jgi:hypothetical protein
VTTVNIELSILRGFWRWMLEMEADGVMFNPVLGVRVKVARNQPRFAPREIIGSVASPTL